MQIFVNMDKARLIAHEIRRKMRSEEFAPFDEMIAMQIPGTSVGDAEIERQAIRDKYHTLQTEIDAANTPEDIKAALDGGGEQTPWPELPKT